MSKATRPVTLIYEIRKQRPRCVQCFKRAVLYDVVELRDDGAPYWIDEDVCLSCARKIKERRERHAKA